MTEGSTALPAPEAADPPPAGQERRFSINEDWAATIFGLVLLILVLAGVISGTFLKALIP